METGFSPLQQRDTRHSRQRSRFPGGATREVLLSGEPIRGQQYRNPEYSAERLPLLRSPANRLGADSHPFLAGRRPEPSMEICFPPLQPRYENKKAAPLAALNCQGTASFFKNDLKHQFSLHPDSCYRSCSQANPSSHRNTRTL